MKLYRIIYVIILISCGCTKFREQQICKIIPTQTPPSHNAENTTTIRPCIYYPLAQKIDSLNSRLNSHSYWRTDRTATGYIIAENIYMYHEQIMIGVPSDEFVKIDDDSIHSYQLFISPLANSISEEVREWKKDYIIFCAGDRIAIAYENRNTLQNGEEFLFKILKPASKKEWEDFQHRCTLKK